MKRGGARESTAIRTTFSDPARCSRLTSWSAIGIRSSETGWVEECGEGKRVGVDEERGLGCSDINWTEIDGAADSDVRVRFYSHL